MPSFLEDPREAIEHGTPVTTRQENENDGKTCYSDVVVYPLGASDAAEAVIRVDDVTDRVRIEQIMVQTEKMMSVGGLAAGNAARAAIAFLEEWPGPTVGE
mgnify:CR=1 FL=1